MDCGVIKDQRKYWLALRRNPDLPASLCKVLLDQYDNVEAIFHAGTPALARLGLNNKAIGHIQSPDWSALDAELQWAEPEHHHLISYHDHDYPGMLKELHNPPPLLFALGYRDIINTVQFAIVGSRNPTGAGKRLAAEFASQLAAYGFTITSGLALGIDCAGHLGALESGGRTIAVLGNGLNTVYPARHKQTAARISAQGLLISEFSPDTPPLPHHFPMRNRIISGMSTGVLVVEATKESGSLITARYAMEQGREVFAIPGSIHSPLAKGCHALIKQGAKLVENIQDIIEELGSLVTAATASKPAAQRDAKQFDWDEEYQFLIRKMGFESVTVDELVNMTGLTTEAVSSMLLILELHGLVESEHGGRYIRV